MKAKTIKVDTGGFIPLDNFKDWVDTKKVKFYDMKVNKDKTLTVKFYDKNRKLIKPNG